MNKKLNPKLRRFFIQKTSLNQNLVKPGEWFEKQRFSTDSFENANVSVKNPLVLPIKHSALEVHVVLKKAKKKDFLLNKHPLLLLDKNGVPRNTLSHRGNTLIQSLIETKQTIKPTKLVKKGTDFTLSEIVLEKCGMGKKTSFFEKTGISLGTLFPYRKTFLCYFLLPFIGFIYTASLDKNNLVYNKPLKDNKTVLFKSRRDIDKNLPTNNEYPSGYRNINPQHLSNTGVIASSFISGSDQTLTSGSTPTSKGTNLRALSPLSSPKIERDFVSTLTQNCERYSLSLVNSFQTAGSHCPVDTILHCPALSRRDNPTGTIKPRLITIPKKHSAHISVGSSLQDKASSGHFFNVLPTRIDVLLPESLSPKGITNDVLLPLPDNATLFDNNHLHLLDRYHRTNLVNQLVKQNNHKRTKNQRGVIMPAFDPVLYDKLFIQHTLSDAVTAPKKIQEFFNLNKSPQKTSVNLIRQKSLFPKGRTILVRRVNKQILYNLLKITDGIPPKEQSSKSTTPLYLKNLYPLPLQAGAVLEERAADTLIKTSKGASATRREGQNDLTETRVEFPTVTEFPTNNPAENRGELPISIDTLYHNKSSRFIDFHRIPYRSLRKMLQGLIWDNDHLKKIKLQLTTRVNYKNIHTNTPPLKRETISVDSKVEKLLRAYLSNRYSTYKKGQTKGHNKTTTGICTPTDISREKSLKYFKPNLRPRVDESTPGGLFKNNRTHKTTHGGLFGGLDHTNALQVPTFFIRNRCLYINEKGDKLDIQKKQRSKKIRRENSLQEKRKRFTPRPIWLRYRLYDATLENRYIKTPKVNPLIGKVPTHEESKFQKRSLDRLKNKFFKRSKKLSLSDVIHKLPEDKELYTVSRAVKGEFKRMYWSKPTGSLLRANCEKFSNQVVARLKQIYCQRTTGRFSPVLLHKIRTSFNLITSLTEGTTEDRSVFSKIPQRRTKASSPVAKILLNLAEYNHNAYLRIQHVLYNNIAQLTIHGKDKVRASRVGFTPFKTKYEKNSKVFKNMQNDEQDDSSYSGVDSQNESAIALFAKNLLSEMLEPSLLSRAETHLHQLRLYWAYSKTTKGFAVDAHPQEHRWANTKQRQTQKHNKTSKLLSTLHKNLYLYTNRVKYDNDTEADNIQKRIIAKKQVALDKLSAFSPTKNNHYLSHFTQKSAYWWTYLQCSINEYFYNSLVPLHNTTNDLSICLFHLCALLTVLGISSVRSQIKFSLILFKKIRTVLPLRILPLSSGSRVYTSMGRHIPNNEGLLQNRTSSRAEKPNSLQYSRLHQLQERISRRHIQSKVAKTSYKIASVLHRDVYKAAIQTKKDIQKEVFHKNLTKLYTFLAQPSEQVLDVLAYIFLVEWVSDIQNMTPTASRKFLSDMASKITHTIAHNSFILPSLSLHNRNLGLNIQSSVHRLVQAPMIQRRLYNIYEALLLNLNEPDADLLLLRKKGMIFLNIWGDFLKKTADDSNINIAELASVKEEQIKLLEKCEEAVSQSSTPRRPEVFKFNKRILSLSRSVQKNIKKGTTTPSGSLGDTSTLNTLLVPQGKQVKPEWGAQQFISYQDATTSSLIDQHLPQSIHDVVHLVHRNDTVQQPIGTLVCQIYSGLLSKQISKNVLIVGSAGLEKTLLVRAIAGETEIKIITDNAYRYAIVHRGVAVGIKFLQNVFDSLVAAPHAHLFLIEDIHAIGERRPFIISDHETLTHADLRTQQEIHEKNQVFYQNSKHLVTHFMKPYKGDFSQSIPTNHFSFDLFKGTNDTLLDPLVGNVRTINTVQKPLISVSPAGQPTPAATMQITNTEQLKSSQGQTFGARKLSRLLIRPAETPAVIYSMSVMDNKKETLTDNTTWGWGIVPSGQWGLSNKKSTRKEVALLADMALSSLSVKLDMITDLLVIIDSVKGNRGFVIFATTHVPQVLDPALRRPGRLDETIYLSTSLHKNDGFMNQHALPADIDVSNRLTHQNIHTRTVRWGVFKTSKNKTGTKVNKVSKNTPFTLSAAPSHSFLTQYCTKTNQQVHSILSLSSKVQNIKQPNIKQQKVSRSRISETYFNAGVLLVLPRTVFGADIQKPENNTKHQHIVPKGQSSNIDFIELVQRFFILNPQNFLIDKGDHKKVQQVLVYIISGRLGEMFYNTRTARRGNTLEGKEQSIGKKQNRVFSTYGITNALSTLTSLIFSYVQKQYIYKKNFIVPKLLSFDNNTPLMEYPSPPATSIVLPARRYQNYKRSFEFFNSKRHTSNDVFELINLHQDHRLVKRLYRQPVQEVFRNEIAQNNKTKYTTFNNAGLMIGAIEPFLQKTSSSQWFVMNRILSRHRNALTNQWWTGQLSEHNVETTVRSDIDWRYAFIKNPNNKTNKTVTDIMIDFPDTDQHYNPRNRRWILTKGNYNRWFDLEKTLFSAIYSHYVFDSFVKAFHVFEQNRDILDFYAYYTLLYPDNYKRAESLLHLYLRTPK